MKSGELMDAIIELSHERGLDQDIIVEIDYASGVNIALY